MTFPKGRPSIGIIPLGTGNDLSRSLNWGGKYKSKPLKKFLMDIGKADKVTMDRWTLKATVDPSRIEKSSNADTKLVCEINISYFCTTHSWEKLTNISTISQKNHFYI